MIDRRILTVPRPYTVTVMTGGLLSTELGKPNYVGAALLGITGFIGIKMLLAGHVLTSIGLLGAGLMAGSLYEQHETDKAANQ